jgi:hypothetical protein
MDLAMSPNRTSRPGQKAALCPSRRACRGFAKRSPVAVLAVTGLLVTAACSASHSTPPPASSGSPAPTSSSGQGGTSATGARPGIVAVTTSGALVVLDPTSGTVTRTLVSSGVVDGGLLGEDEIAVSPGGGTIYFTGRADCSDEIESVPAAGGTPTVITTGQLPAISPSGTDLAFTRQDEGDCNDSQNWAQNYSVVVRTLSTGSQVEYPMAPDDSGQVLPYYIEHLSWAPGGGQLAVSITEYQDNSGYKVVVLSPGTAQFYSTGPGTTSIPVIGSPDASDSYYTEAAYLPDGNLFVNRDCCLDFDTGHAPPADSNLMQEISSSGSLIRNVAIGIQSDVHTSLDVDPTGNWLLYVAGTPGETTADGPVPPTGTLYVSQGGARPTQLATGILAAAWL